MVFALVFVRGCVNAVDYPTRQAFVMEIVGGERVVNAVSLNSVLVHAARIVGPALAGVLIATVGLEPCFALNAASFAVHDRGAARAWTSSALRPDEPVPREPGAVRAALRYVRATPELWIPLGLMAVVGTLGFNFQAILPLLARFTFDGGASAYAALVCAMGVGAVAGALATGARGKVSPALLAGAAIGFGGLSLLAAGAPTLALELVVLAPLGAASVMLAASVNSSLQLATRAEHARQGDGAVLDRLPRLDPDRRPAGGLALRGDRPARGPGDGRGRRRSSPACWRATLSAASRPTRPQAPRRPDPARRPEPRRFTD